MMQIIDGQRLDPKEFCFWLQGFCELTTADPTHEQWELIKEHLELVFAKVTTQSITTSTHGVDMSKFDWQKVQQTPTVIC